MLSPRTQASTITADIDGVRTLIMSLRPTRLATPDVKSPGLEAASVAAATFRGTNDHVLPHCFVCGPARAEGDGLRIFSDWLKDPAGDRESRTLFPIVAAPWQPTPDLADVSGNHRARIHVGRARLPRRLRHRREPILLGRMSARIVRDRERIARRRDRLGQGPDRRKHFAGSALFNPEGDLLAFSEQTWIQIDEHAPPKEL